MSEYYDINKPYSLQNWNYLIQQVNNILENPPPGCDPLEPLSEAEDPHIWTTEDIEVVRDVLMLTCPDIKFTEELKLWNKAVLDEIIEALNDTWCNCEEHTTTYTYLTPLVDTSLEASPSTDCCCNELHSSGSQGICGGGPILKWYFTGIYYPPAPEPTIDTLPAWNANLTYQNTLGHILEAGPKIKQYQSSTDTYSELVDIYIKLYNNTSNPALKVSYAEQICNYGELAEYYQNLVDTWVTYFQTEYASYYIDRDLANSTAESLRTELCSIATRYPSDYNVWTDYFAALSNTYAWGNWIDPRSDTADEFSNYIPFGYVKIERSHADPGYGPGRNIKFSPNGTPYLWSGSGVYSFALHLTHPYNPKFTNFFCDSWPGGVCPTECGSTLWCQWSGFCQVRECWMPYNELPYGGTCLCADATTFYTWSPYIKITYYPSKVGDDFTLIQEQVWGEYNDWYSEHPQYDNRHQGYC